MISSTEVPSDMADYFGTLGGRVTVDKLRAALGKLSEKDREKFVSWGLDLKRREGWRDCSCVAETNSSMSARWIEASEIFVLQNNEFWIFNWSPIYTGGLRKVPLLLGLPPHCWKSQ